MSTALRLSSKNTTQTILCSLFLWREVIYSPTAVDMENNKIVGVQKLILFSDLHSIPNINYSAQFTMLATEACAYLKNENAAPTALLGKTYPGELPQVDLVGP